MPRLTWLRILFAAFSFSAIADSATGVITFEYPPATHQAATEQEHAGYAVEAYRALTAGSEWDLPVTFHPLARANAELESGSYLIGLGTRSQHPQMVAAGQLIPVQIGQTGVVFVYLKRHFSTPPEYNTLDAYAKHTVCSLFGAGVNVLLSAHGVKPDVSNSIPSVFDKLSAGRCELAVLLDFTVDAYLKSNPDANQFAVTDFHVMEMSGDILINTKLTNATQFANFLNKRVKALRADETLKKIAERNFGTVPQGFFKF